MPEDPVDAPAIDGAHSQSHIVIVDDSASNPKLLKRLPRTVIKDARPLLRGPLVSQAFAAIAGESANGLEANRSAAENIPVRPETPAPPRLDADTVARAKRRSFTAEYKQRILAEADAAAAQPGAIGALLRREGLYSSLLVTWRREREAVILKALTPRKRGPKSKRNPRDEEMRKLRRENQRLTEELRKAEIVIAVLGRSRCSVGVAPAKGGPSGETLMDAVTHLAPTVGVVAACKFLGVSRASFYRRRSALDSPASPVPEPASPAEDGPGLGAPCEGHRAPARDNRR